MLNRKNFLPSFALVVVTIPVSSRQEFTYHVPESFRSRLSVGMRVLVPVGQRKITGIVTSLNSCDSLLNHSNLKDILDVLDEVPVFSHDLIRLWYWASDYYLTSLGEMLTAILPGGLRSESTRVVTLKQKGNKLKTHATDPTPPNSPGPLNLTAAERAILAFVMDRKRVTTKTIGKRFPQFSIGRILQKLEVLNLLQVREYIPQRKEALVRRDSSPTETLLGNAVLPAYTLSPAQDNAYRQIGAAIHASSFQVFLLYGVTGSGKTEVYVRTAQTAVNAGRRVLILVPEIALTHGLVERMRHSFGWQVAVLHSALQERERWAEWRRIARGEASVVIGARSAVFAPIPHLGLIVVDEEHDTAYKQEEGVRYNARDVAIMRGRISSCPVILGSATPSLESYLHSRTRRYQFLALPERAESRHLPHVEIVDLCREARAGNPDKIFSPVLRHALVTNQQAGKQSVLFLNRRGYANYLQCRFCGEVLLCPRCSVTLTFHLRDTLLRCHYCGFSRPAPTRCPQCRESALEGCGFGTQQVEEALKRFLPGARVARLDRDSVRQRGALDRILSAWYKHKLDILIGTQMVAKGHDVPNVTLVGVLLADVSLNRPDFRAAERTFQLLAQVAGRAGRGQDPGRVIIQTYAPQHYSVRCAAHHDFTRFAAQELRYRNRLGYPPFTRVVNIRFEGPDQAEVKAGAERFAQKLQAVTPDPSLTAKSPVTILGPAPAPIERLKGRDRWHVLLKGENSRALHALVQSVRDEVSTRTRGVHTIIDVDPYSVV